MIDEALGREHPPGKAILVSKGESATTKKDRILYGFAIPPAKDFERLRIQFISVEGELCFTVEARFGGALQPDVSDRIGNAVRALKRPSPPSRFEIHSGTEWGGFDRVFVHPHATWLNEDGSALHETLLDLVRDDVRALSESGLFDALPEIDTGLV